MFDVNLRCTALQRCCRCLLALPLPAAAASSASCRLAGRWCGWCHSRDRKRMRQRCTHRDGTHACTRIGYTTLQQGNFSAVQLLSISIPRPCVQFALHCHRLHFYMCVNALVVVGHTCGGTPAALRTNQPITTSAPGAARGVTQISGTGRDLVVATTVTDAAFVPSPNPLQPLPQQQDGFVSWRRRRDDVAGRWRRQRAAGRPQPQRRAWHPQWCQWC